MGHVLDGGVCLVRVPKGILGDETAHLLGSFVVAKVWQTATHRARLGQAARVDASLVVDECQNFLNLPRSFDEMLAEARGYRLVLGLPPPAPPPTSGAPSRPRRPPAPVGSPPPPPRPPTPAAATSPPRSPSTTWP